MKRAVMAVSLILAVLLVLSGCGAGTANQPEPTQSAAPMEPTATVEPTPDPEPTKTPEPEVIVEPMTIPIGDQEIFGRMYRPAEEGVYPVIILSHGYNGSHSDYVKGGKFYAQNGFIVYAFDFRGGASRSKSSGTTTEMTIFTEKEDLLTVYHYIKSLDFVDKDHIFLLGASQGGLVTALVAEELKDELPAIILYFPAFNIPDDWRNNYDSVEAIPETFDCMGMMLGREFAVSIRDFYVFDNIGGFEKDVLIFHGDYDGTVALKWSEQAVEHYKNAELIVFPGEGHGFSPSVGRTAMQTVVDFMKAHLSETK